MGIIHEYTYTDLHEINLDWLIKEVLDLRISFDDFKALNLIKIGGIWDISEQYQINTIVNNNNDAYISTKPVPAGIDIHNTDYWTPLGEYSSIIEELQNAIIALQAAVGDDTSGLVKDVDDLTSVVGNDTSGLVKDVDDLTSIVGDDTSGLVKDVNNLKSRDLYMNNVVLISDSYGVDSSVGGKSWMSYLEDYMPTYNFTKYALGGGGFGWPISDQYNFIQLISSMIADDEIGQVIFLAGANDGNLLYGSQTTEETIKANMATCLAALSSKFPNAVIKLGFVGKYDDYERLSSYYTAQTLYNNITGSYNIVNIPNAPYILLNRNYLNSVDHIHPTSDGSKRIAKYMTNTVRGLDFDVCDFYQFKSPVGQYYFTYSTYQKNNDVIYSITYDGSSEVAFSITNTNPGIYEEFLVASSLHTFIKCDPTQNMICSPGEFSTPTDDEYGCTFALYLKGNALYARRGEVSHAGPYRAIQLPSSITFHLHADFA